MTYLIIGYLASYVLAYITYRLYFCVSFETLPWTVGERVIGLFFSALGPVAVVIYGALTIIECARWPSWLRLPKIDWNARARW